MHHLTLDEHLSAASLARHWVCEVCPEEHLPGARRWIAELLTSELVANALEHGRGPVTLTLTHDREGILVGISDGEVTIPAMRSLDPQAESGRGIALVDALATAWGYYPSRITSWHDPTLGQLSLVETDATDGWPAPTEVADGSPAAGMLDGKTVWFHLAPG
ncbi:ATP-binding protein [Kineococcus gynurae]|uniref:ATP-binding protein n=1 Tax=Kineococcus gynurae TaxID=452979 RepID=A0ABV5LUZ4_9ACTN